MTTATKVIATGVSTFSPLSVSSGPDESVYIVNGLQRGWKWDRRAASAVAIGVDQPRVGPTVTAAAGGALGAGDYIVGYRWLDVALQPGSLSPVTTTTATANQRFYYSTLQTAPTTRITTAHQGYVQFWRSAVDITRVVYTVYGTGAAFTVSATANDEGYSKYTVADVTGLRAGDVVVLSGHTNSRQDGQQTVLKVVDDDNTLTTDKGFVASGSGTATQRHFYFAYAGTIASHADNGAGKVEFTTTAPHRLALGCVVVITGYGGTATYNTTHKVRAVDTPFKFDTDVNYDVGNTGTGTYTLSGFGNSTDNNDGDEISDTNLTASTNISMTLTNDDGELIARRFNPPPTHKSVVITHGDRTFYGVDAEYGGTNAAGATMSVAVTLGDRTITGTNTAFTSDMIGRYIHITGEALPRLIQKFTSATVLEVDDAIVRANGSSLAFQIIPPMIERNKLYYSYPQEPESVPATNVVQIPDTVGDNDTIKGLVSHGNIVYAFKDRHAYRFSYSRQPRIDASPTLAFSRGLLNHRCVAVFEDNAYCLDQSGIYMVPLWGSDHLSRDGVQHTVRPLLDFVYDNKLGLSASRWSFVTLDSERRQVRFFVAQSSWCSEYAYDTTLLRPKTCIVYNLDTATFDLEGYVHQLGGGCQIPIAGRMRSVLGGQRDLCYIADDDLIEGVDWDGSDAALAGTVVAYTAGTPSIELDGTPETSVAGAPIAITSGPGRFQVRRIVSSSGAVCTLDQAFGTAPTTSSAYQVGGVLCRAKTGAFAFPDSSNSKKGDASNKRGVRIAYQPFSDDFYLKFYKNHATSAMTWEVSVSHGMGVDIAAAGDDFMTVDATLARSSFGNNPGYSIIEVSGGRLHADTHGDRWLGIEVQAVRGAARPKFFGMELMGVIPHPASGGDRES